MLLGTFLVVQRLVIPLSGEQTLHSHGLKLVEGVYFLGRRWLGVEKVVDSGRDEVELIEDVTVDLLCANIRHHVWMRVQTLSLSLSVFFWFIYNDILKTKG